jgi:uncharacterized membrane protein YjgN (DUF898 family)
LTNHWQSKKTFLVTKLRTETLSSMLTDVVRFSVNQIGILSVSTDFNPNIRFRITYTTLSSQFIIWRSFSVAITSDTSIFKLLYSATARRRTRNYFDQNMILKGNDFDWW